MDVAVQAVPLSEILFGDAPECGMIVGIYQNSLPKTQKLWRALCE